MRYLIIAAMLSACTPHLCQDNPRNMRCMSVTELEQALSK